MGVNHLLCSFVTELVNEIDDDTMNAAVKYALADHQAKYEQEQAELGREADLRLALPDHCLLGQSVRARLAILASAS